MLGFLGFCFTKWFSPVLKRKQEAEGAPITSGYLHPALCQHMQTKSKHVTSPKSITWPFQCNWARWAHHPSPTVSLASTQLYRNYFDTISLTSESTVASEFGENFPPTYVDWFKISIMMLSSAEISLPFVCYCTLCCRFP